MRAGGLGTLMLVLLVSCGGDSTGGGGGDGNGGFCDDYVARLRSCGLISAGHFTECEEKTGDARQCQYDCIRVASCDDLATLACGEEPTGALAQCTEACASSFVCRDNPQSGINALDRCDGYSDCNDGSDEEDCPGPKFTCGDGFQIPQRRRCDGSEQCDDGSDEGACAMFTCANGETIIARQECDGDLDCSDASDETQCVPATTFVCDGVVLSNERRCNGELDCPDGSDETGCAEVTCN